LFSFKRILKIFGLFGAAGVVILFAFYLSMRSELPSVESLKDLQWQTPMQIYSADGLLMDQYGEKKRIPLALDEMPQQLLNAILATEDDRFYLHFGVDPIGMSRAILGQIMGQNKGGASTISMQVARNFFGSTEQTYSRKLREIFTTFHIEYLLTKDEILALYMNKIPLGHRAFGFGAAAQVYYNKDVKELSLAQIAVLAGLPKAPSTLNPISRPDRAVARRAVVLKRMFVSGYITSTELEEANKAPVTAKKHGAEIQLVAPYVADLVNKEMINRYGREQAYTGGYKVFTTVSSHLQLAAQQSVINNIISYDKRHGYRGPIRSLRTKPEDSLTPIEQLTEEEIADTFTQVESYHSLQPAIVTEVFEKSVSIRLKDNSNATIDWQGMAWARSYTNDLKQGDAPKQANEILSYGNVIYIAEQQGELILSQLPQVSSALISLSPDNGAIQASVGGFSFKQSQFNRVTQAKRQVGSNIKPFLYSAALDHGFTLASLVNDVPINQWDQSTGTVWRPKNSPPNYSGEIRVKLALAQSKNVIAVRLLRAIGLDKVIPHIASFGFPLDDLPRDETLALGSASFTPIEMASGFATFANGGFLIEPYIIERIEDSFGNIVYQANPAIACEDCSEYLAKEDALKQPEDLTASLNEPLVRSTVSSAEVSDASNTQEQVDSTEQPINKAERVISAQNAFLITKALNTAIWGADWSNKPYWQGTGWRAQTLKRRDIAGKTGTTNSAKDAWFSGFSRRLVTTSWIGFDEPNRELGRTRSNRNLGKNQVTGGEAGAVSAQPAWVSFMKVALAEIPNEPFIQPEDIISVRIDKATGKLTKKTDKTTSFEFFLIGTAPTEYVTQDNSDEILDGQINDLEDEIF